MTWAFVRFPGRLLITFRYSADTVRSLPLHSGGMRSPRACTGVGEYFSTGQRELPLAERWDGSRWRVQPVPDPAGARRGGELSAVSCPAATRCFAVGQYFTKSGSVALAETWNRSRWAVQPLPRAASNTFLLGVSCATPRVCAADRTLGGHAGPLSSTRPIRGHYRGEMSDSRTDRERWLAVCRTLRGRGQPTQGAGLERSATEDVDCLRGARSCREVT